MKRVYKNITSIGTIDKSIGNIGLHKGNIDMSRRGQSALSIVQTPKAYLLVAPSPPGNLKVL